MDKNIFKQANRFALVTQNGTVRDTKGCISICFVNQGTTGVFVNGCLYLAPGDHIELSTQHANITDDTDYEVYFEPFVYIAAPLASFGGSAVSGVSNVLSVITSFIKP